MNESGALAAFSVLSNKTRLRILKKLVEAGMDGLTAGEIAQLANATPSRASFHLSAMADSGLVTAERRSRQIVYRVDFETVGELIGYLLHDCCGNNDVVRSCCGLNTIC